MNWSDVLVGAAIGAVITIIIAYWFYALQNRRNAPLLAFRSFSWPLVAPANDTAEDELVISFRGAVVPRLTRSRIALWNPGQKVIEDADVSEVDPLAFGFRRGEILEARVVQVARDASRVGVSVTEGRVRVSFDFLDHGDGAVIDVLHTDEHGAPYWSGTIKGLPHGIWNYGHLVPTPPATRPEVKPQYLLTRGPHWLRMGADLAIVYLTFVGVVLGLAIGWGHAKLWGHVGIGIGIAAFALLITLRRLQLKRRFAIPAALSEASDPRRVAP